MTTKVAVVLAVIIISFLAFPIVIGVLGGVFGAVVGIIGGIFGLVFGALGAVIGAVFGAIGEVFNLIFNWPACDFFDGDLFLVTVVIIVAVLLSRKRNLERRSGPMK